MNQRRELRALAASTKSKTFPLFSQVSPLPNQIAKSLEDIALKRTNANIRTRLQRIDLATVDSPDLPIRSSVLISNGIQTLADVAQRWNSIGRIRGIGDVTVARLSEVLKRYSAATRNDQVIPNDSSTWSDLDFELVSMLIQRDAVRRHIEETKVLDSAAKCITLCDALLSSTGWFSRFSRSATERATENGRKLREFLTQQPLDDLVSQLELALTALSRTSTFPRDEIKKQWSQSSATLQVLAEQLYTQSVGRADVATGSTQIRERIGATELLPESLQNKIREFTLILDGFKVPLRGYQAFGAKFSLVGQGTILGDEMGLGKTMQALAVAHHLDCTRSGFHGLVVAPVSILENWRRETHRATQLQTHVLHGNDRDTQMATWVQQGGLAFTSYQTLRRLDLSLLLKIDLVIIDEAHKVKNPEALQTQAAKAVLAKSEFRLLLSGTPLENRTREFIFLLGLANPSLGNQLVTAFGDGESAHRTRTSEFVRAVAPGYLRRNQSDVLDELPEIVVMDEVIGLKTEELAKYKEALTSGNHAVVRQSVTIGLGATSSKMEKLQDLLEEYQESQRKVLVYSCFLGVLDIVCSLVGPNAFRIDGSVPPMSRQDLVDKFSAEDGYSVLVMQIDVGGTGLNIQAASVVIITEPQWKPTTESQAIGRAHRMGQIQRVNVHRLIADDTIDERIEELLEAKQQIFDAVVRPSQVKLDMPEAVSRDMSELSNLVAREELRLSRKT